ncbi:MOSC domain-containing protein [Myxococcaceae bacterium GXIMD 01537]
MSQSRLLFVCVGMPRTLGTEGAANPLERPWVSGTYKEPVHGPVRLGLVGLAGDGQADLKVHGGPEKAVLGYGAGHYDFWRERLGRPDVGPGAFGENLVLEGASESTVCIGDVVRVGTARLQVSQPRQPCWKQARRWGRKDMPLLLQETGRVGWYYRVLEEGEVKEGLDVELLGRPCPAFTVAHAHATMHGSDREAAAALAECAFLSPGWRESMRRRAAGTRGDDRPRLYGTQE